VEELDELKIHYYCYYYLLWFIPYLIYTYNSNRWFVRLE